MRDGNNELVRIYEEQQQHSAILDGLFFEEQTQLSGHLWNVSALAFSGDGLFLASASWDKSVKIWNLSTLEVSQNLEGHTAPVTCLTWLPTIEFLLVSASSDKSVIVWNTETGELLTR